MSKKKKTVREGSFRSIWRKNKKELVTNGLAGRGLLSRAFPGRSLFGGILQIVKVMIMLTVIHGTLMLLSVMIIPHLMGDFYGGIFGGMKSTEITMPMLLGSWFVPCLFYVAGILFVTCCAYVMFWKWLSKLMRDITERHKAKVAAKYNRAESDKPGDNKE